LIQKVQEESLEGKEHHYYPLAEIQAKSELKKDLLDHILVFENYPFDPETEETKGGNPLGFTIDRFELFEHTHYDFEIQVLTGQSIGFRFRYNQRVYRRGQIEKIEEDLRGIIKTILEHDGIEIGAIEFPSAQKAKKGHEKTKLLIAATFTSDPIVPYVEWWCRQFEIPVEVRLAPYNQVFQQLLDHKSLFSTNDGINVLLIRFEDWIRDTLDVSEKEAIDRLERNYADLTAILKDRAKGCTTFVGVFPVSTHLALSAGLRTHIEELNKRWKAFISDSDNAYLIDFYETEPLYGIHEVFDAQKDMAGHLPFSDEYDAAIGTCLARKVVSTKTLPLKVIAVDCDNTLWKGICGEDGTLGVRIEGGYLALQKFLLDRYREGFLLVLCSKNNEGDVKKVFENNPRMLLKWEHFVSRRINWRPKSENIRDLARELNLSADSFIFLDDSGPECTEVMLRCPEVLTLPLPREERFFSFFLRHVWAFDRVKVTEEDRKRSEMVAAEKRRVEFRKDSLTLNDFLQNIGIRVNMRRLGDAQVPRVSQLTQRTNQFNLNLIRRTEEEIRTATKEDGVVCWVIDVEDRFGDYGLVGVVMGKGGERKLTLDTFLLSCRVLGRGVENAVLHGLRRYCEEQDLKMIEADYIPSEKNKLFLEFLEETHWQSEGQWGNGVRYRIPRELLPRTTSPVTFNYQSEAKRPEIIRKDSVLYDGSERNLSGQASPDSEGDRWDGEALWDLEITREENLFHRRYYLPLICHSGRALLQLPVYQHIARTVRTKYVEPENQKQERMVLLWKELLHLDSVGIDDDFFELGGHSLTATRIVCRLPKLFDAEVSLREFFDNPTVRKLSAVIHPKVYRSFARISPVPKAEVYDVSHAQRRLWVLDQMGQDLIAYNLSATFLLEGDFNPSAFRKAFQSLVKRHESLRTTFVTIEGRPMQKVHEEMEIELEETDLRGEKVDEEFVRECAQRESVLPYDLSKGPLFRARLLNLSETRYGFLLNMHHIVSDGWSFGILGRDLLRLYQFYCEGKGKNLPPLPLQYKDFASWQNNLLKGDRIKACRAYWHKQLSGPLPVLNFPLDYARPPVKTFNGKTILSTLERRLTRDLHALARSEGTSLFMLILALVKVLLYRYTSQEDLIVGSPIAGRNHPDLEDQIGFYVNTLALRDSLRGTDTFRTVLRKVKQTTVEAYDNQIYPFDMFVEELDLKRDVSRSPLFDVMVVLQNNERPEENPEGLKITGIDIEMGISQFDLTFNFNEMEEKLQFEINFNTDLFRQETIERLRDHLIELANSAVESPSFFIGKLNLLTIPERKQLLEDFSDGRADSPREKTIVDLFEEQVEKTPDCIAVAFEGRRVTYRELNERANQLAHGLREDYGIGLGDIVSLMMDRSEWMIIGLLGILKSGGTYLPIDIAYPPRRIDYIIKDSGCRVVLTEGEIQNLTGMIKTGELGEKQSKLRTIDITRTHAEEKRNPVHIVTGHDLAYIIYTSGSTGLPKGVMIEHGGFVNMSLDQIKTFGITESERVLQFASPSFDASLSEIFMALFSGATLVLIGKETIADVESFVRYVEEEGVTVVTLPPFYLNSLDRKRLGTLKAIITAGEPAIVSDAVYYSRGRHYFNAYGPTETSVCASIHRVTPEFSYSSSIPIGKPIANTSIYILDDFLSPVPVGVPGEICISGVGVARGYLNRPELTKEKFIENPFRQGERLFKTGDLGRWLPDGHIEFEGRRDEQMKIRGHRIEPGEIEQRLLEYPAIREGIVMAKGFNGSDELVAYIVCDGEVEVTGLRNHLRSTLPDYMIPSYFMPIKEMSLTPHGKVDRRALPDPDGSILRSSADYQPPATELEKQLVQIWEAILGRQGIGVHDNFFELGGNSLKALQMIARVQKELSKEATVPMILQSRNLREFGKSLSDVDRFHACYGDDSIVLLHCGKGPNLICLPPLTGYALAYRSMAEALPDYSVYGLNFIQDGKGLGRYIELIKSVQPEGPYLLLGYSAGGNLSFELCQEMEKQGHRISDIILLDSWRREGRRKPTDREATEIRNWYFNDFVSETLKHEEFETFIDSPYIKSHILKKMKQYIEYTDRTFHSGKTHANIHLIKADRVPGGNEGGEGRLTQNWMELTTGKFIEYNGFGSHMEMLRGENLWGNVKIIRQILEGIFGHQA
jgi:amino acid adenylation domain-containing protein/FkbH-like protein